MNSSPSLFFKTPPPQSLKKNVLDVGKKKGDYFLAIAVGWIDNFISNPSSLNKDALAKVLKYYDVSYPPNPQDHKQGLDSVQLMDFLIRTEHRSNLVENFSVIFRQIAVDKMRDSILIHNKDYYYDVFADIQEKTSLGELRKPSTRIADIAIDALANALSCKIVVSRMEPDKDIPARDTYPLPRLGSNNLITKSTIQIDEESAIYNPKITNLNEFKALANSVVHAAEPVIPPNNDQEDTKIILEKITEAYKQMKEAYDQKSNNMHNVLAHHEHDQEGLDKIALRDLYIKSISIQGVGKEHQHFFDAIKNAKYRQAPGKTNYDDKIAEDLIHVLVVADIKGYCSLEELIDNKSTPRPS